MTARANARSGKSTGGFRLRGGRSRVPACRSSNSPSVCRFQVRCVHRYNTIHQLASAPVAQRLEQQTHNLLVRGSNPCGGTNQLARVLTLTASACLDDNSTTARWSADGAILL